MRAVGISWSSAANSTCCPHPRITCDEDEGIAVDEGDDLLQQPHEAAHDAHRPRRHLVLLLQVARLLVHVLEQDAHKLDDGNHERAERQAAEAVNQRVAQRLEHREGRLAAKCEGWTRASVWPRHVSMHACMHASVCVHAPAAAAASRRAGARALAAVAARPVEVGDRAGHDDAGEGDNELVGPQQPKQVIDEGVLEPVVPVVAHVAVGRRRTQLQHLLRSGKQWQAEQCSSATVQHS